MQAGRVVLEILSTRRTPRSSEGAFVALGDGTVLFAYSKFTGRGRDDSSAVIAARLSRDAGATWTRRDRVLVAGEGRQNVMSVSFLRLHDGRIALFYLVKNGLHDCRLRVRFSEDEAKTWTPPTRVIPAPGYFVTNNDRVVQLSTGRLIVPASFHRRRAESTTDWKAYDSRGVAMYFLSDDCGRTWREAKTWWAMPAVSASGLQEPGVVELADGRLLSWCRTDLGCQYGMYSTDGGEGWSLPAPTPFRSPCSPLSMKRIPRTGHLLAVWNDHSGRFGLQKDPKGRTVRIPLVSAVSRDEANTWASLRPIEIDPEGRFCYTAIHFPDDEHVLLAYSVGGRKFKSRAWGALRIRRVRTDWLDA